MRALLALCLLLASIGTGHALLFSATVGAAGTLSVALNFENTTGSTQNIGYVALAHPFKKGDVRTTDSLKWTSGGTDYPVQYECKATHDDGTCRHGFLAIKLPAINAGATASGTLSVGSATNPAQCAPTSAALIAAGYEVTAQFAAAASPPAGFTNFPSTGTASAATALSGASPTWRSGCLVNEFRVSTTLNSGKLKVTFDILAFADGSTMTDVISDNAWFFDSGKSNLAYTVTLTQTGGTVVTPISSTASPVTYSNQGQWLNSKWHREIDSADRIRPNPIFDMAYFTQAGAILNYDLAVGYTASVIDTHYSGLNATNTAPMGTALVETSMPTTGERCDIGPQSCWMSLWIMSQYHKAYKLMMAIGDVAGAVPWHMIDEATGKPIKTNPTTNSTFWLDFNSTSPGHLVPTNGWPTNQPFSIDINHVPDLTYLPYLVTGSHYRLDLLQAQGDYAITAGDPVFTWNARNAADTAYKAIMLYPEERGKAWATRGLAQAAYITPDNDSFKSHLMDRLGVAMDGFLGIAVTDDIWADAGAIKGFVAANRVLGDYVVALWQQSYIVHAFSLTAGMGITTNSISHKALEMLQFMRPFYVGQFNNDPTYKKYNGIAYFVFYRNCSTENAISSWATLQSDNVACYDADAHGLPTGSPTSFVSIGGSPVIAADGYAPNARAALASLVSWEQSAGATDAYDFVNTQLAAEEVTAGTTLSAVLKANPKYNIIPMSPLPTPP